MLSDITKIPVDNEVCCQNKSDVARGSSSHPPEPHRIKEHQCPQSLKQELLQAGVSSSAGPGPPCPAVPFVQNLCQPVVLAFFCAERLHHGIAGDRIGHRCTDLCVLCVRQSCSRSHVVQRKSHGCCHVRDCAR